MIYELRVYQPVPGQMPKLLARFRDKLLPIWERHGIRPIGFWTTLVGESSNELTYILPWESLADRETRWTAFHSERDGLIVASISARPARASTACSGSGDRAQRSNHRRDGSRRRKGAPLDDHSRLGPGDGLGDGREH